LNTTLNRLSRYGKFFIDTFVSSATDSFTYQTLKRRHNFSTTRGNHSNATGVSFEYMSPDNNAGAFRPFCDCWSYPGTNKF
jgi:hypothetical protein